ncbi:MAG: 50S ribosomal protein L11 methyltransferase [Oscillospiraceae bacterium]|jgi:ribosomal protein L11 methyltransferase|nr:50S ribosomal protein L11 methyltransferase [Oscillospiraceae bacterium]MCI1989774.1 50S ribosomal protein L11 methyltransferase [Oscillospiraceae bacterium]MCI2034377.1 50S ribosomal protein L11 methyltransferase [Oscillospiraceae bacterium]
MDWTEVKITVDAENVDLAGDIAQMTVPWGIYIEDYSHLNEEVEEVAHIDLIDEKLLKKDRTKAVVHVYISPEDNPNEAVAFLRERYAAAGIPNRIKTDPCVQEDWINNWKKYFHPIPVGKKLLIRPDWEKAENPEGRVVVDLEPGIAFGTGTHETTRLCMEFLEETVTPGCSMLDVGCGSGILSVAGLLLGAGRAVGVDIDPLAVKTAAQNAERNHVADRFTGICGSLTEKVEGKFDVVAANIVADVILQLARDIEKFLAPGAVFLVSGIIDEREQDVLDALKGRFDVTARKEEKGWVAACCRLRAK